MQDQAPLIVAVSAISIIVGAAIKSVTDAIIRYRQSEGQMNDSTKADLRKRIVHLEQLWFESQQKIAELNRLIGQMESKIAALEGRNAQRDAEEVEKG